jgi:methyl-accepting chemotaxis protein
MFRFRLAAVIGVSFCFVLLLGGMLYWISDQVALNFQRSQSAYEAFDHYERLSQEAYRHFKQRMDRLATDNPAAEAGVESSKQRLYTAMEALRGNAVRPPVGGSNSEEWQTKPAELERVARFTAFLEASEYRFDEVERLRQQGKRGEAAQALSKFSEEEIDGKFQPLIDAAIGAERETARVAQERLESLVSRSRWIAILAASVAALFSLASGIVLLRGVRKPIAALMQGTDAIASGHLEYRIALVTGDEFGYLAAHFNQMADELERQQEKLREAAHRAGAAGGRAHRRTAPVERGIAAHGHRAAGVFGGHQPRAAHPDHRHPGRGGSDPARARTGRRGIQGCLAAHCRTVRAVGQICN